MAAPERIDHDETILTRPTPFISVAFVAALIFVPFVIATGLLTDGPDHATPVSAISLTALRGSFDQPVGLGLRPGLRDP